MRIVKLSEESKENILKDLLKRSPDQYEEYRDTVEAIIKDVKVKKDKALFTYTKKFDGAIIHENNIKVTQEEIDEAYHLIDSTFVETIKKAQKKNKDLKAAIVLNMLKPNVKIKEQAIEQLEKYELPILSSIHDRISYGSSFLNGGVMGTNDSQAKNEIEKLSNEILNML